MNRRDPDILHMIALAGALVLVICVVFGTFGR